ncbi:MAG TPA: AtpZ/AtpI family protein [Candidatus Limnocylindrales bacterium]|jgi:F0F1-type ATP synthase assembly protein I|nr:AtpZ/AtpI family protein [Candidatus Limnocylindrales bacterium]
MPKRPKTVAAQVAEFTSLALLLPISVLVGYVIGYFLDKLFHTHFLYIVFLLIGVASGLIQVIRELLKDSGGNGGS